MEAFVALLVPVVAALAQAGRSRYGVSTQRQQINRDLDLFERLPENSSLRDELLEHIERSARQMLSDENVQRRNPFGMVLGGIFVAVAVLMGVLASQADSWSWVIWTAAIATGIMGAAGFALDVQQVERDDRGRPLHAEPTTPAERSDT